LNLAGIKTFLNKAGNCSKMFPSLPKCLVSISRVK